MFDALTDKFSGIFRSLSGRGRITEANVSDAMREVRKALLEADVNYQVVKQFCKDCLDAAMGADVIKSLHPGQVMVKIVHDELVRLMGPVDTRIYFVSPGPTVILLAGLQGSGKTTTAAKLGRYIRAKGRNPVLVADDLQRPAAIDQLETLGQQSGIPVYTDRIQDAVKVARDGVRYAKQNGHDVVILDTAGRLHIDEEMMQQIADVAKAVTPQQIYLVCDAMTGQDAVNVAEGFHKRVPLTGIVLTRVDGDARGGAALSMRAVTGQPIKLIGVGEGLDALEEFHPDRIANRILGMGDVVSLVEKAAESIEQEEAERLARKIKKGNLDLDDMAAQLRQMRKMGGLSGVMSMLPGVGKMQQQMAAANLDDGVIRRQEAIISSMTREERRRPQIIQASRKRRIAAGSGTSVPDVNKLLKQHATMVRMMKKVGKMGRKGMMRHGMPGMPGGGMPPRM